MKRKPTACKGPIIPLILFSSSAFLWANPEAPVDSFTNGAVEDVGTPDEQPDPCSDMVIGRWYGTGVQGAADLGDITPPEADEFITFDNPDAEGEYSTLSQRFALSPEVLAAADDGLVTLLASFQVNLPPATYAKGRVQLFGLDADGEKVQELAVASFRPDHIPETWETIHLRDFSGLDIADDVTSVILEIGFTADYPVDAADEIAVIDDIQVLTHTVTDDVEVDDTDLATDNVLYVTATTDNDLVWAFYDEANTEISIFAGPVLIQTVPTTDLQRLKVYMGRGTDAFFIVDSVGARFANFGAAEVYLHSGNDLGASSVSLNDDQFNDLDGIVSILEDLQTLLTTLADAYEILGNRASTDVLANEVGPRAATMLNEGYQNQLAFKNHWESAHQITIEQKIASMEGELQQLEILLDSHDAQMEIILNDEENSEYDSQLEALEEQWEATIDDLEQQWEDAEFAVSDEGPEDEYDRTYPNEDDSVTTQEVEDYIDELEQRLENLDDAIEKDEDAYEDLRDGRIDELESAFLTALDNRIGSIRANLQCLEDIADLAGEETTGEVVTMLAPYEASAEAQGLALEAAIQQELKAVFAKVGRVSHDDSAANNFGRGSLKGAGDADGPADTAADADPDELGEEIFGIIDLISDLINDWLLPDDVVTNPVPLDCSEGAPSIDDMSAMVFGMAGIDIVVGTINNDLLSGGGGTIDLIIGLAGNDVLRGAEGIDLMLGMGGDDFLHAGDGFDILFGDAMPLATIFPGIVPGDDCLEGEDGIDLIFGEPGADHLDGGFDIDLLVGGSGDDRLFGDAHNDLMIGWKDHDILLSDAEDNQKWSNIMLGDSLFPLVDAGEDELYATDGNEIEVTLGTCTVRWLFGDLMIGGEEIDLLEGAGGVDVQLGGRGDDIINGREQIDIQFGGRDNDIIRGNRGGVAFEVVIGPVCVPIRIGNIMFGNPGMDEMHGGADMDVMFGNGENDTIFGNDGSFHLLSLENIPLLGDWIFAGDGADWVDGMAGSDKIWGGPMNDILYGDDGALFFGFSLNPLNDIIFGNDGDDTIYGGLAPDFLFGNWGNDTIYNGRGLFDFAFGNRGEDTIWGERGVDIIFGNRENDEIHGGRGLFDLLFGNRGEDKIWGERGIDFCYGNDGDDLIWGGQSIDLIWGDGLFGSQSGDDEIWGEDGADIIFGNNGDDIGHGGPRMDIMFGNQDQDCFEGNDGNDLIFGNSGADQLRGQDGKDRIWGDNSGLAAIFTWLPFLHNEPGDDIIWGGPRHDRIKGGGGNDEIYGEDGNDKIRGELGLNIELATGDDLIFGGPGKDKIRGQKGNDRIYGGLDRDKIKGGKDQDLIYGGSGDDKISGDALLVSGHDEIYGGCGDDKIKGGLGNDIAFGGTGNDKIKGKAGNDQLVGNDGNDKIRGGLGADRLFGDAGADKIVGGWADDVILGGTGDDYKLKGGLGADQIHGGSGADVIRGNAGKDTLDTGDDSVRDKVIGGLGKDVIYADKPEDKIRRKKELVSNSSDNDSGIQGATRPTEQAGSRFVYGCKWEDSNGDGIRQEHEPMVFGWSIFADLNGNMQLDPGEPSTRTERDDPDTWPNEEGCYCLEIPASITGPFNIQERLDPTRYRPSYPNPTGTWAIGGSLCLHEGEVFTGLDFGNVPVPTDEFFEVCGRKWYDHNGDGIFQEEEITYNAFIVGTLIWADLNVDGVFTPGEPFARVEKDGTYCLRVPIGQQIAICEDPSSNWSGIEMVHTYPTGPVPCHLISSSGEEVTCDFGNKRKPEIETITGQVWHDIDGNGDQSSNEQPVTSGMAVLDENRNGRADSNEPSAPIADGIGDQPAGSFRISIPTDCLPPETGFNIIYVDTVQSLGRTTISREGDLTTEEAGKVREVRFGLNTDTDGDGLSDQLEARIGTSPTAQDSEGDKLTDYEEFVILGTSPTSADGDQDDLSDREELLLGTNPHLADSDGDGVPDGQEVLDSRLDPLDPDSNNDGIWDGIAVQLGILSGNTDPDNDGASTYLETYVFHTNPLLGDTDGDGYNDLLEGAAGYSPNNRLDSPARGLTVPAGGEIISFSRSSGAARLEAILESGKTYRINKSNDLQQWEMGEAVEATQRLRTFEIDANEVKQFFQVEEMGTN